MLFAITKFAALHENNLRRKKNPRKASIFFGNTTIRQRNSKRMKSKDKAGDTKVEKKNLESSRRVGREVEEEK